jgi:hypothetical protein
VTGRLAHALRNPEIIFSRLNSSRRPSRFDTINGTDWTRSWVVKRRWQLRHSLRRRMPASFTRESVTLEFLSEQYGQRIISCSLFGLPR